MIKKMTNGTVAKCPPAIPYDAMDAAANPIDNGCNRARRIFRNILVGESIVISVLATIRAVPTLLAMNGTTEVNCVKFGPNFRLRCLFHAFHQDT